MVGVGGSPRLLRPEGDEHHRQPGPSLRGGLRGGQQDADAGGVVLGARGLRDGVEVRADHEVRSAQVGAGQPGDHVDRRARLHRDPPRAAPGHRHALSVHPVAQVAQASGDPARRLGVRRAGGVPRTDPSRQVLDGRHRGAHPEVGRPHPARRGRGGRRGRRRCGRRGAGRGGRRRRRGDSSRAAAPVRLRAAPGDQEDRKTQGRAGAGSSPAQPTSTWGSAPTVGGHRKTGCMTSACSVCGAAVSVRIFRQGIWADPGAKVEERTCTNPVCVTHQAPRPHATDAQSR